MRNIYLHGALGQEFGTVFRLEVETAAETIRALSVNFKGFRERIAEGTWHVVRGKTINSGKSMGLDEIAAFKLGKGDLHILPVIKGSKRSGILKAVIGVALIGVSLGTFGFAAALGGTIIGSTTLGAAIGTIGLSMAIAGVSQLLTPATKTGSNSIDPKNSFMFTGPEASSRQGAPIPIVYGEVVTGGVLISGGLDVEDVSKSSDGGKSFTPLSALFAPKD